MHVAIQVAYSHYMFNLSRNVCYDNLDIIIKTSKHRDLWNLYPEGPELRSKGATKSQRVINSVDPYVLKSNLFRP